MEHDLGRHDDLLAGTAERLRAAGTAVARASRGRLVKWGVGLDPVMLERDARKAWWARAHLTGGRAVRTVTVAGFASGPDAAEALADRVAEIVRARR